MMTYLIVLLDTLILCILYNSVDDTVVVIVVITFDLQKNYGIRPSGTSYENPPSFRIGSVSKVQKTP
jgi:hypothetical protein